jgi:transcriptional regulator with XRE-family HTH domain
MKRPSEQELESFRNGPSFGKVLRETRELKKVTLREAAHYSKIDAQIWSDLELGRRWPHESQYEALGAFLNLPPALFKQNLARIAHEMDVHLKKHPNVAKWFEHIRESQKR